ncbi:MAG TPA: ABC transporter permease [Candidatus Limnocylindrales bacterium]|nr:ABC transporter permease [Candidatus Limnocylindrales bacterium]
MAERIDPLETMPVSPYARLTRRLLWLLAALVMGFLYLPIVLLIVFSFNEPRTPGLPITGLTLDWYEEALTNRVLLEAVWNSILVAVLVAVLATVIGTMAAFPLVRGRIRYPGAARVFATLPIMLPGMLLGIAILIFMRRVLDLQLSLLTVVAGHLVLTVPFVILIVAARLQGFDRNLEWAAADLGADGRRTVRHIILPLIWPAILAGALISVTLSIDEFVVTFFTVGPQLTLPIYIYTQIKFGVTPEVNAIATLMLAATLGIVLLGAGLLAMRRRLRRGREGS